MQDVSQPPPAHRAEQSTRGNGAAIVTTLRNAGNVIDSFIAYHLAIGFAHLYLFFDDPNDPDLLRIAANPRVTVIPHDAALRDAWARLPDYAEHGPHIAREVMSRQTLNVIHAMNLARERGMAWLLHIDADELFYSPLQTAAEHFAQADAQGFEVVGYRNFEALPERDEVGDFFREVNLFKIPPGLFQARAYTADALRSVVKAVPQLAPSLFHFYSCGKSAMRLSAAGITPLGVHSFIREGSDFKAMQSAQHFILHYPCCGFETFWTKYATLGRFDDRWWGTHDIASSIGTFHLEARDVVATGNRAAAVAFYRRRVAIRDANIVNALIGGGFLARFRQPADILAAGGGPR